MLRWQRKPQLRKRKPLLKRVQRRQPRPPRRNSLRAMYLAASGSVAHYSPLLSILSLCTCVHLSNATRFQRPYLNRKAHVIPTHSASKRFFRANSQGYERAARASVSSVQEIQTHNTSKRFFCANSRDYQRAARASGCSAVVHCVTFECSRGWKPRPLARGYVTCLENVLVASSRHR